MKPAFVITLLLVASSILSARVLEVGIYQNGPKISFDENGKANGIFADILNQAAKLEKWDIKYQCDTWENQIVALENGKIDILVDVAYSEERAKKFKMTKIPIIEDWLEVYCLKTQKVISIKDLNGKRIAVLESSIQEDFLENEIKQLFGIDFSVLAFPDYKATQKAVLDGSADVMIASRFFYFSDIKDKQIDSKHLIFRPSGSYFAFKQNIDTKIVEDLDKNIIQMKNTPGSVYYKSLDFWLEKRHQNKFVVYFYWIFAALMFVVISLWLLNKTLKKSVKTKTAELLESEKHIGAMLELNPDLVFILDSNGIYLDCHTSSPQLLHAPWHELAGKNIRDFLPAEIAKVLLQKFRQTSITRELLVVEYSHAINNKKHFFEARILAYEKDKIMVFVRDNTIKEQLEEKLRLSQKMEAIGVLTAEITHEINSPVQYILNNTCFLKDYTSELIQNLDILRNQTITNGCPECYKLLNKIDALDLEFLCAEIPKSLEGTLIGIEKIQTIIAALKDFSYPRDYTLSNTDINKALESVITMTSGICKNSASIEKNFSPDLPLVQCFADKMNQVYINLIVNAVDAIKEKKIKNGIIRFTTSQSADYVHISIADNGAGIPADIKNKIFEPFFTTKELGKGTGQGLFIVYEIIYNLHNGTVDVNSEIGKGTEFVINLPLKHGEKNA